MGEKKANLKKSISKVTSKLESILYPSPAKGKQKSRKNSAKRFWIIFTPIFLAVIALIWYLKESNVQMLDPQGTIGMHQRGLMIFTAILGAFVVIPVFSMTIYIANKYRDTNKTKKKYSPNWDTNVLAEVIWWGIPIIIIAIIATVTWISTFQLDPYKKLTDTKPTMNIQVISLDWKWLFIYPDQKIATINFAQFPKDTPVDFSLTSDTVMNSFWIPRLSGQIYAMPGMVTHLNLDGTEYGDYPGSAANITGEGFSGMNFTARVSSEEEFNSWVTQARQSDAVLDKATYTELLKKSKNDPVSYFSGIDPDLFDNVVMKYMHPGVNSEMGSTESNNAAYDKNRANMPAGGI